MAAQIISLSKEAYKAVGGTGYARLDFRLDTATNELYVLEVNAQCGLSEDENHTSIGAILRYAKASYASALRLIINAATKRSAEKLANEIPSSLS